MQGASAARAENGRPVLVPIPFSEMASTENVRVVIRIRPFLQTETRDTPLQLRQQGIQITTPNQQPRQFQFDSVLPPQTSQAQVYDTPR